VGHSRCVGKLILFPACQSGKQGMPKRKEPTTAKSSRAAQAKRQAGRKEPPPARKTFNLAEDEHIDDDLEPEEGSRAGPEPGEEDQEVPETAEEKRVR
jgi:hypothetical protein